MDTPKPILAYATPTAGVRFEDDRIILPQPPPGWEMLLLATAIGACILGAFAGLASTIKTALSRSEPNELLVFSVPIFLVAVAGAVYFTRTLVRRKQFGLLPATIRRLPDGRVQIHLPARWGDRPRTFPRGQLSFADVRRRGWAGDLLPLYELRLSVPMGLLTRETVIHFVTPDQKDSEQLEQCVIELLIGTNGLANRDSHPAS